jgi:hypothetical protein
MLIKRTIMIKNYIRIFTVAALAFGAAPALAQTQPPVKKPAAKPVKKVTVPSKPAANKLGDAAAKVKTDTTRKGGQNTPSNNTQNGGSLSEEIVVTTVYKPVLADAVKIRRNPNLEDTQPYKAPLSYTTLDKRLERNSDIRQLEAMKMPAERDSVPANNFVRAGFGSLRTTFGEAFINNGQDEALQVGGFVKHFGQQGNLNKQNESRSEAGVFGKSIGDMHTLTGRVNYLRRNNYYYGINPNVVLDAATPYTPPKQHYNLLSAEGELARNYQDTDRVFTYALKLNGYLFNNAYQAKENNVVLSGFVNQTINEFYAGLGASLDLASQKDAGYALNNSFLRLNPYLKFQGDNYKIDAGVNIAKEFGFSERFFIFPAVKLEYQVIPNFVRLFAEAKGDVNRTSFRNLYEANPFLDQSLNIVNSVDKLDITIGLKGRIIAGLGFKAAIFRNSISDLPLFVSNAAPAAGGPVSSIAQRFNVVYDTGKARVTGFNGELDYKATNDFNLFGRVEFRDYRLATQAQPWNLPKFKLTAGTAIHINNKVDVNGSLYFRGATKDVPFGTSQVVNIKAFADVSGGVTYKATKQISVFVQANNILNNNYQTYYNYANYGFNIFGGAGFSF